MNLRLKAKKGANCVVTRLQRLNFFGNSEQLAQEILDVRRERDDQLGLLLGGAAPRD